MLWLMEEVLAYIFWNFDQSFTLKAVINIKIDYVYYVLYLRVSIIFTY